MRSNENYLNQNHNNMTTNTIPKPIAKKIFTYPEQFDNIKLEPFEIFFYRYLRFNKLKDYRRMKNDQNVYDYLCTSGSSYGDIDIIAEHKQRFCDLSKYPTAWLQADKYENLMTMSGMMRYNRGTRAPILYICDYPDAIAVWRLDTNKVYRPDCILAQRSETDPTEERKDTLHLTFDEATIITKPTYQRI